MKRRAYLARCGVLAGLVAGCAEERPPRSTMGEGETSVATRRENVTPSPGTRVAEVGEVAGGGDRRLHLVHARLAESVFLDHGAFVSLERRADWQFVVAELAWADGSTDLDALSFALVVDGEAHRPGFRPQLVRGRVVVGLATPSAPASEAILRVTPGEEGEAVAWRLGAELVGDFDAVPAFAVRDAAIRATGDGAVLAIDAENAGDRDGTFRGLVAPEGAHDLDRPVAFDVPRGERVGHEVPLPVSEDPESVRLTTDWSSGTRRFEYARP